MSTTQRSAATGLPIRIRRAKDLNAAYDDYMDDIDAIWNNADSDDDVAWATARFQVGVLQQQADNNYQDADMEKIQYDQTEAGLVYQAQQLMVTYEQSRYNMENLQSARNLMQAQYEATAARQGSRHGNPGRCAGVH